MVGDPVWFQLLESAEGVAGCDPDGLYGPLAVIDAFRCAGGISVSHEVRRVFLVIFGGAGAFRPCSASSSEEASASESGVDRRRPALDLPKSKEAF